MVLNEIQRDIVSKSKKRFVRTRVTLRLPEVFIEQVHVYCLGIDSTIQSKKTNKIPSVFGNARLIGTHHKLDLKKQLAVLKKCVFSVLKEFLTTLIELKNVKYPIFRQSWFIHTLLFILQMNLFIYYILIHGISFMRVALYIYCSLY